MDENSKNLSEENIYECKLRGTLKVKNDKMNCIIGDCVEFDAKERVIEKIEKTIDDTINQIDNNPQQNDKQQSNGNTTPASPTNNSNSGGNSNEPNTGGGDDDE